MPKPQLEGLRPPCPLFGFLLRLGLCAYFTALSERASFPRTHLRD